MNRRRMIHSKESILIHQALLQLGNQREEQKGRVTRILKIRGPRDFIDFGVTHFTKR